MSTEEIRVLTGHACGEITEKKSRFIANVYKISSEEEALAILESVRKQYYDARHNCYAYVLGSRNEIQRFSDDKEPQGTAGKPILEVLTTRNFRNTLIVVTRYFGGILLGTGGLLRAYTAAAREGLLKAEEEKTAVPVFRGRKMRISCDYSLSGKVQYLISQMEIPVFETLYDTRVTFVLAVREELASALQNKITEATNAASEIAAGESSCFILQDGHPVEYSLS